MISKLLKDFKEFAVKGNVIDLAVGVIVGAAFSKIISSLVSDIIMPPIGLLTNGVDFSKAKILLKSADVDEAGKVIEEAVYLKYGNFVNVVVEFTIVAFCVFIVVKLFNSLKRKAEDTNNKETPTPKDIELLTDIRDLLQKQNGSSTKSVSSDI